MCPIFSHIKQVEGNLLLWPYVPRKIYDEKTIKSALLGVK